MPSTIPKLQLLPSRYYQRAGVNINLYFLPFITHRYNHVFFQYFSKSLVNSKNKHSSCDFIRDLTVETASKSRHILNTKRIAKTTYDSLINRQLGLWGNSFSKRMLKQALKCTENCVLTRIVYTVYYIIIFPLEKADNLCS